MTWGSVPLAAALLAWGLHRYRVRELTRQLHLRSDERLAERTRIAQELYDTLLQGFLSASMQLHLAVDRLPVGSPERESLDRVLRMMGEATDEGRQVLQGLRSSDGEGQRLETRIPGPVRAPGTDRCEASGAAPPPAREGSE